MTRIKICGITNAHDAELAAELGVDWIGLNFYRKSPRFIEPAAAQAIVAVLPTSVVPVALFVQEPLAEAQRVAQSVGIHAVQMHTDHREIVPASSDWICAFAVHDDNSLRAINTYVELLRSAHTAPHAILVDAHVPGLFGGTGHVAPWHLLADVNIGVPLILAGGLTPENVGDAIRIVRPYAVDVASGVESAPGKKDPEKMRRFVDAVRNVDNPFPSGPDALTNDN